MQLRPYQTQPIDEVRNSFKKSKKRPCVVLPCGAGKSCLMAWMAKQVTDKGGFVLLILHRHELQQQLTKTFIEWGVNTDMCLIGMIQAVRKHLNSLPIPTLIICEEGHHGTAKTYLEVFNYFSQTRCVFFTATPVRLTGSGLGDICDDLIIGVSAKWLIANGYLSPYKYYSIPVANFDGVGVARGDYRNNELSEIMEDNKIYGDTVENYKRLANGKKTIVYCASVKASKQTAIEFIRNGYNAISLDGTTKKDERLKAMEMFRSGEIQILTNAMLFGEGLDIPDVECVILLRKTKSLGLFIQQSMRCMRMDKNNANKTAIIIDHVGNVFEHGFPDDDRIWSLDTKRQNEQNIVKVKTCPNCFAVIDHDELECPYCNYDFTTAVRERQAKELIQTQLVEMQQAEEQRIQNLKYKDVKNFTTFAQLVEFQKDKKYKFAFCLHKAIELNIPIPKKYNNMLKYMNL